MYNLIKHFGETAKPLARNPLGIIALFIVLVYGFAALVTAFAGSFTAMERIMLICFLVFFPLIVLGVFTRLVVKHTTKLYAPSDFQDEDNYMRMMTASASLSAAVIKNKNDGSPESEDLDVSRIVNAVWETMPALKSENNWRDSVLWVDDRPENNVYERQAFETFGLRFTLALTTSEALEHIRSTKFAVIISDMGRKEGSREGYVLLDALRKQGDKTPLFFYAASNAPEHKRETAEHGGQGCTNNAQELFEMVTKAVIRRQTA